MHVCISMCASKGREDVREREGKRERSVCVYVYVVATTTIIIG